MNVSNNIIAVIRSVNERTFPACYATIARDIPSENIYVVNERPFEVALRKTYQIGIESKAEWMMTVDADVLLLPETHKKMLKSFLIFCKLKKKKTGMYQMYLPIKRIFYAKMCSLCQPNNGI